MINPGTGERKCPSLVKKMPAIIKPNPATTGGDKTEVVKINKSNVPKVRTK